MPTWSYVYELRREGTIVSTGHLTSERQLAVDDRVPMANGAGRVKDVVHGREGARLILELEGTSEG
jgi:hypothetical protein